MPSEKQIEAAHKKASDILDTYVTWEEMIAILTAAEQAEPAPPESRLREALEKIVGKDSYIDASPRGDRKIVYGDFARIARAALAQEDGR